MYNKLTTSSGGSVGIKVFVKLLNEDLPVAGRQDGRDEEGNVIKGITPADAKKIRKAIV